MGIGQAAHLELDHGDYIYNPTKAFRLKEVDQLIHASLKGAAYEYKTVCGGLAWEELLFDLRPVGVCGHSDKERRLP